MREKRKVELITCDICHNEFYEFEEKNVMVIQLRQSTEKKLDVCKDCYYDLENHFRERFKEEEE